MLNCNHIQSVEMLMKHLWSWKLVYIYTHIGMYAIYAIYEHLFCFVGGSWPICPLSICPMLLIYLFSVNNLFGVRVCFFLLFSIGFFSRSCFRSLHPLRPPPAFNGHRSCSFAFSSWLNLLLFNFHTVSNKFFCSYPKFTPMKSRERERPWQNFWITQRFSETMNVIAFSLLLSKFTVWSIIYGGFLNKCILFFSFYTVTATRIL